MQIARSDYASPFSAQPNVRVLFGAGKVKLLSDFDGTYFPSHQSDLRDDKTAKTEAEWLQPYFARFDQFLQKTKGAFHFVVTTGRNRGEFEAISELIRRRGIRMPMPESVVTNNGGDEFNKVTPDEQYYQGGPFPFPWTSANQEKRDAIQEATGWDGPKYREKIVEVLKSYDFPVRQDPTTNSPQDYGRQSTLAYVHDPFNHREHDYKPGDTPISPWIAALKQDGDLGFFIGFPKDMPHHEQRRKAYQDIRKQIGQFMAANSKRYNFFGKEELPYAFKFRNQDREYGNHPVLTIRPQIGLTPLDKSYDVKQAIAEASKNNDLVIVAGDSSNDVQMLNPARYIELSEELQRNTRILKYIDDANDFKEEMDAHPELKAKIDKLPFIGIIIDNPDKNDWGLNRLFDVFGHGPNRRLIKVKQGDLLEGVQEAVKLYAEQNPAFKAKLDSKLKTAIGLSSDPAISKPENSETSNNQPAKAWYEEYLDNIKAAFAAIYENIKKLLDKLSNLLASKELTKNSN